MGEEILSWCFERLYSPLYDRVEKHCGKIAALITTLAIAVALTSSSQLLVSPRCANLVPEANQTP
jgi:hypothetical protein